MSAKQKKDSLKNPQTHKASHKWSQRSNKNLSFFAITEPEPPPIVLEELEEPTQAQGALEHEDESYEELMVDSLVSVFTVLAIDGSLDEDSQQRLTTQEVYDSISVDRKLDSILLRRKLSLVLPCWSSMPRIYW